MEESIEDKFEEPFHLKVKRGRRALLIGMVLNLTAMASIYCAGKCLEHMHDSCIQPAIIHPVQVDEAEKYQPKRPISDNPHHYIPNN